MAQPELNECPTAAALAAELIAAHYPDLREARIVWALTDKKAPCKPHLLSAAERWFDSQRQAVELGSDVLCLINGGMWDFLSATGQRVALVDHLLAHVERKAEETDDPDEDGAVAWKIRPHDVEEFQDVFRRRGAWQPALRDFVALARQLPLPTPARSDSDEMQYAGVRREIAAAGRGGDDFARQVGADLAEQLAGTGVPVERHVAIGAPTNSPPPYAKGAAR